MTYILIVLIIVCSSLLFLLCKMLSISIKTEKFKKDPKNWIVKYWVGEDDFIGRSVSTKNSIVTIKNEWFGNIKKPLSEISILYKIKE